MSIRLDRFLADACMMTRSEAQKAIRAGRVADCAGRALTAPELTERGESSADRRREGGVRVDDERADRALPLPEADELKRGEPTLDEVTASTTVTRLGQRGRMAR